MRPPPPLLLRCPASRAWRAACALIAAAAGAAMAAWVAGHAGGPAPAVAAAALAAAVAGGVLGRRLAGRPADCDIAWDGERWSVDGVPGALDLRLDGGRWMMLLQLRRTQGAAAGRSRWLAIEAPSGSGGTAAWRALRAAIYSPPPAATPAEPNVRAADRAAS